MILQTALDDLRNQVVERLEAQHEAAGFLGLDRRHLEEHRDSQQHGEVTHLVRVPSATGVA